MVSLLGRFEKIAVNLANQRRQPLGRYVFVTIAWALWSGFVNADCNNMNNSCIMTFGPRRKIGPTVDNSDHFCTELLPGSDFHGRSRTSDDSSKFESKRV